MLLLFVESLPNQSHCIISGGRATSPEGFSGFFGKSLLLWLNPLFLRGYRRKLLVDDLYPIDDELASAKLTESLSGAWARTAPQRSRRLAWSLAKVFVGPLFLVQLPRFGLVAFAIAQPLLISAALDYVQRHASLPSSFGPAFIGAFALNYIAVAVSTVWSQHLTFRMLTMVRGALIGMIYKHSLLLHASDSNGGADAVSLISADVERILQTLQWVLNILPNVAQVAIGFYILYGRIGIVFVAPLIIAIGNTPAMLTPAATFAAFAITQSADPWNQFEVSNAFTSLALLSIMINPIAELVTATTNIISALSCLDRIQVFLQKTILADGRQIQLREVEPPGSHSHSSEKDRDEALSLSTLNMQGAESRPVVRITNASFGYNAELPILRDINMEVLPSKVVMVFGPVASGKSTLLRSLMGETHILAGKLECLSVKQTAYCDQEPWLLNQSIRQNILAFQVYNAERYERAIRACQLEKDFAQLPGGDETLTGSKGVSLSVGGRGQE
ncbi:uncharacterized protein RSE6_07325 [Rhynchosporium secalis]|uniref:ABC transmembrane type-1 domain-containing protein n=1 Tax=Rhynchosporium secalis TaxID=38038 RepID=A0A1E1MCJ2_RHYSE|nr:uncharacterized protein RSE6_07325 [Rhynchosporium secalis]